MASAHDYRAQSSNFVKFAVITAMHGAFIFALMNMKVIREVMVDHGPTTVTLEPTVTPPVDIPDPVAGPQPLAPLPFVIPQTVVNIDQPPNTITTAPIAPPGKFVAATPGGTAVLTEGGGDGATVAKVPDIYKPAIAGNCARPDYPARALREGAEGTVTLSLLIGARGTVTDAKIARSSGSRELDRAAVSALSLCTFKPATNNGVPEQAWGQIAYVWTLES